VNEAPGKWTPVEVGDEARCALASCGKVTVGHVGKRGGKTWVWMTPDGSKVCSPHCAKLLAEEDAIADVNDEMAFNQWADEMGIE
jgi:hypothetical protein